MISFRVLLGTFPALGRPLPQGFNDLVARARPTVVEIDSTMRLADDLEVPNPFPAGSPEERRLRRRSSRPVPAEEPDTTPCAIRGVIIDPAGLVVTNEHTLGDADGVQVRLHDGRRLKGRVLGRDQDSDLALVQVDAAGPLPAAVVADGAQLRVGDWILTIGGPFAAKNGVAAGIVSARSRQLWSETFADLVDANPPVELASFGGPVFDMRGAVVGLTSAIFPPNAGRVGIGLAVSGSLVRRVVRDLREHGRVRRGWIGVSVRPLSTAHAVELGLKANAGATLVAVAPGSPAQAAGLTVGDVVVRFAGRVIDRNRSVPRAVAAIRIGERVVVELLREGRALVRDVAVGEQPAVAPDWASADPPPSVPERVLGLTLAPPTPEVLTRFAIGGAPHGAVVTEVVQGSLAQRSDVRRGDVITEINLQPVHSPRDVRVRIGQMTGGLRRGSVLLRLARGRDTRFVALRVFEG